MAATGQQSPRSGAWPTIVLVHGAFADASSWSGVIERLQQQGYTCIAPANPLRGVTADSAYTASLLGQIDGPVLLVGYSYGGAVITNADGEHSTEISAAEEPAMNPGMSTSFGELKQLDAGHLNVGYAEAGPPDAPVVILLHGWPYDIHSFADVTPALAATGYRVPYYGPAAGRADPAS